MAREPAEAVSETGGDVTIGGQTSYPSKNRSKAPYDYELAQVWARVAALCKSQGRRLEAGDAWIAATAVHRKIPLLTHDAHFVGLNVPHLTVVSYVADATRKA